MELLSGRGMLDVGSASILGRGISGWHCRSGIDCVLDVICMRCLLRSQVHAIKERRHTARQPTWVLIAITELNCIQIRSPGSCHRCSLAYG